MSSWNYWSPERETLACKKSCRPEDRQAKRPYGYDHGIMTMIIRLPVKTKTIPAGTFKARCLALMDEVAAKRQAIVITKRGKPVAKLVPVEKEKDEIFGFMKGKVTVNGDIVGPILTPEEWGDLY
jgi:prevent-host-death family protein